MLSDPQLLAREAWVQVPRAYADETILQRSAYGFDGQPGPISHPSPTLGELNAEVCGLSETQRARLGAWGITGTSAVPKRSKAAA